MRSAIKQSLNFDKIPFGEFITNLQKDIKNFLSSGSSYAVESNVSFGKSCVQGEALKNLIQELPPGSQTTYYNCFLHCLSKELTFRGR